MLRHFLVHLRDRADSRLCTFYANDKGMCVEGGSDALLIRLSCLSVSADKKRPFTSRIRYLSAARIFTPDRIESVRKSAARGH